MANYYDFVAVQNYTLGCGALKEIKRITYGMGQKYLVMVERRHITDRIISDIANSFTQPIANFAIKPENMLGRAFGLINDLSKPNPDDLKITYEFYDIPGKPCSSENAKSVADKIKEYAPDVIVAAGAGKCLDIVRTATHYIDGYHRPKIVLCPTILASNSSATSVSILYNEENTQMVDFWNLAVMPECVIIDTDIIINSPVQTFVAGIGDQIASSIEAMHTLKKIGAYSTIDRLCIAHHEAVIDILKKYSRQALEAMKRREITPEFEWVCHAITRYTGPQFAVATAFLSHILDEALIGFPEVAQKLHGLIVGFGVLPEMVSFGTPDEIYGWVDLFREIGIPVNLAELGIPDCTYEEMLKACENAADKIMASRSIYKWTPEEMATAVLEANKLVNAYISSGR